MVLRELAHDGALQGILAGDPVLVPLVGDRVGNLQVFRQVHPDLRADGFRDPALGFQVLPGHVVALGTDEAEDVGFRPVLAHKGRGEAEAADGLQLGGDAEDGRGEEVDFVVDDQSPGTRPEEAEMGKLRLFVRPPGQDLVGGHGDGSDGFGVAGVFGDLVRRESSLVDELVYPLMDGGHVGGEHEGIGLQQGHHDHAHHRLSRAAGQDDHAVAGSGTAVAHDGAGGFGLVIARGEIASVQHGRPQGDIQVFAAEQRRLVLDGPTEPDELPLDCAPVGQPEPETPGNGV